MAEAECFARMPKKHPPWRNTVKTGTSFPYWTCSIRVEGNTQKTVFGVQD
jgi:hypothetical protein